LQNKQNYQRKENEWARDECVYFINKEVVYRKENEKAVEQKRAN
jgi:hypothetical protein